MAALLYLLEEVLLSKWYDGMKEDIREEVRLLGPVGLDRTLEVAQMVENRNVAAKRTAQQTAQLNRSNLSNRVSNTQWIKTTPATFSYSRTSPQVNANNTTRRLDDFCRLTDVEMLEKRARGIYFKCDGKYSRGHVCARKELTVLVLYEDGSEIEYVDDESTEFGYAGVTEDITPTVAVSLNSVVGLSSPKIMKMEGLLGGQAVIVLVDSGASHNFISQSLVQELNLPRSLSAVSMGTGDVVKSEGVWKGVRLQLQNIEIFDEFLPLQLGNSDVILGMQWLATLGNTHTNWSAQTIKFTVGSDSVTLRGDPALKRSKMSLKSMVRAQQRMKVQAVKH
jgi:hypothetical protein